MKKHRLIKLALLFSGVAFGNGVYAQDGVAELAQLGPDAAKLSNAYLSPIFKGFGIGLNSGWANQAHSKNLGRFDLRIGIAGAMVPKKDESFDLSNLGLSNRVVVISSNKTSPTVAGATDLALAELSIRNNSNQEITKFKLPKGANVPLIPAPQAQLTVGLIKGVEATLRAIPKISLGDVGSVNMIGGGIKVEILPLIAGKTAGKLLPFDIAVALGYTKFSYEKALDYKSPDPTNTSKNQRIEADITGLNTQLILSKKLLVFTPFVSLGYNTSKTTGGLKGDFSVINSASPTGVPIYTTTPNPVTLDTNNFSAFRSDIGFQLNLAFFRLYASYSVSEYNSFNAGIGFGIGK